MSDLNSASTGGIRRWHLLVLPLIVIAGIALCMGSKGLEKGKLSTDVEVGREPAFRADPGVAEMDSQLERVRRGEVFIPETTHVDVQVSIPYKRQGSLAMEAGNQRILRGEVPDPKGAYTASPAEQNKVAELEYDLLMAGVHMQKFQACRIAANFDSHILCLETILLLEQRR